ncbi:hypothetical protein T439DRAFT_318178 [Meredithblackwellia eburnea MCA 4105]
MQDPTNDIRDVVRSITEPRDAPLILLNVDKYFSQDSVIVHPMLNSPAKAGREGVKSAYKMLRVLTYNNQITFHTVAFDRISRTKNAELQTGLLDLTEDLKLRFLPLPDSWNPTFHIRFLVRIDLRKVDDDDKWYIIKQEDNLPSDFGSTGLRIFPGLTEFSNAFKWACGMGTLAVGSTLSYFQILD